MRARLNIGWWLVVACAPAEPGPPSPGSERPEIFCPDDRVPGSAGCAPKRAEGCPPGERPSLGRDDCSVLEHPCADGFEADPSGWGCRAIAAASCGAGERIALGSDRCVPVGWTTCPDGFALASDGWGCAAIAPAGSCSDGSIARIGETSCLPIADCQAPFPPAEATHFVDPTYADAMLDGRHFRTIGAAIAGAFPSAVIAIERGTYREEGMRVEVPLTFVGRCPAETIFSGSGTVPGFGIVGTTAELRGMRLVGHSPGVLSARGGTARLHQVEVLDAIGAGTLAINPGSTFELEEVRIARTKIAGNTPGAGVLLQSGSIARLLDVEIDSSSGVGVGAIDSGTTLTATRAIIRNIAFANTSGDGVYLSNDARVELTSSLIDGPSRTGAFVQNGALTISQSTIVGAGIDGVEDPAGVRILAGRARLDRVRIADALEMGAMAFSDASTMTITRSVIHGSRPGPEGLAVAVVGQFGAKIELEDSAFVAHPSAQVVGYDRADFTLTRSRIGPGSAPSASGLLLAAQSRIDARASDFEGRADGAYTVDLRDAGTIGVIADSVIHHGPNAVFDRAWLRLERSAVSDCPEVGFFVGGSTLPPNAGGGSLEVLGSVLTHNARTADPGGGGSLMVADDGYLRFEKSDVVGSFAEGLYVDPTSRLEVVGAIIRDTERGSDGSKGMGLEVYGSVTIVDSAIRGNRGGGLVVRDTGTATISGSLLADNNLAGVFTDHDARIVVRDSAILDQKSVDPPRGPESFGFGAIVGGDALFERVLIRGNRYAGIGFDASGRPESQAHVVASVIERTGTDGAAFGHGVLAGSGTIHIRGSWVLGNARVGIAFSHATGLVTATTIADNVVGAHVQDGTMLEDATDAPDKLPPLHAIFTADTRFVDNGSRVGIGQIPLPAQADPELGGPPERRMAP